MEDGRRNMAQARATEGRDVMAGRGVAAGGEWMVTGVV